MSKARNIAHTGIALSNVNATKLGYLDGFTLMLKSVYDEQQKVLKDTANQRLI